MGHLLTFMITANGRMLLCACHICSTNKSDLKKDSQTQGYVNENLNHQIFVRHPTNRWNQQKDVDTHHTLSSHFLGWLARTTGKQRRSFKGRGETSVVFVLIYLLSIPLKKKTTLERASLNETRFFWGDQTGCKFYVFFWWVSVYWLWEIYLKTLWDQGIYLKGCKRH